MKTPKARESMELLVLGENTRSALCKVSKIADSLPCYGIFQIEVILQLKGMNFKLEIWTVISENGYCAWSMMKIGIH